jgi:hypothetical protein
LNVDIPEVQGFVLKPRFYRDERGRDHVEIAAVGSKDTVIHRVSPEIMKRFPKEWAAHCDGLPMQPRRGTKLTDLPGMNEPLAKKLYEGNVQTVEELAILNEAQCNGFGHGTLTQVLNARKYIARKEAEGRNLIAERMTTAVTAPNNVADPEVAELKKAVTDMSAQIAALVQIVAQQNAPKPRGRPKNGAKPSTDSH